MTCGTSIVTGDCRRVLADYPDGWFDLAATSPPYWGLRDYGHPDQVGVEETFEEYVAAIVDSFEAVRRAVKVGGSLWLVLGDAYSGSWGAQGTSGLIGAKTAGAVRQRVSAVRRASGIGSVRRTGLPAKNLLGLPWRVAFALRGSGWTLRNEVVWHKPNPMPENVRDRYPRTHETAFLFTKGPASFQLDPSARRAGTVWRIATRGSGYTNHATFPLELARRLLAACPPGGRVLDPFCGTGTVGVAAKALCLPFVGVEVNGETAAMATSRIGEATMLRTAGRRYPRRCLPSSP